MKSPFVSTGVKLAALWASLMSLYIYADYFGLYKPGKMTEMNQGIIAPLGLATPQVMMGVSLMMIIPSLMIFFSVSLPRQMSKMLNIIFGIVYTVIIALTMIKAPPYYLMFGAVEVLLSVTAVVMAFRWAKPQD
jgi:hypothetical protein